MLRLEGALELHTDDGCDVENDDGLLYAATEKKKIIFRQSTDSAPTPSSSGEAGNADASPEPILSWPLIYCLPRMDPCIEQQLQGCRDAEQAGQLKANVVFCNTFLRTIVDDVARYIGKGRYLTAVQYKAIGDAIGAKYPLLLDRDGSWQTLKMKFCRKLQYLRTKITTEKRKEMQARHTTRVNLKKRKASETLGVVPEENAKKIVSISFLEEDNYDVFEHIYDDEDANEPSLDATSIHEGSLISNTTTTEKNYDLSLPSLAGDANDTRVATPVTDLATLESTFTVRKHFAMGQTVLEEVADYPLLTKPIFLLKEADLVLAAYCENPVSPYSVSNEGTWTCKLELGLQRVPLQTNISGAAAQTRSHMIWRRFMQVVSRTRDPLAAFFEGGNEPVHIGGSQQEPGYSVTVNGVTIETDGAIQTIAVFLASFLAFNLRHSRTQEATLETLEGLVGIRKSFTRPSARKFLKLLNII